MDKFKCVFTLNDKKKLEGLGFRYLCEKNIGDKKAFIFVNSPSNINYSKSDFEDKVMDTNQLFI